MKMPLDLALVYCNFLSMVLMLENPVIAEAGPLGAHQTNASAELLLDVPHDNNIVQVLHRAGEIDSTHSVLDVTSVARLAVHP